MRKIIKSAEPQSLTRFRKSHPRKWEEVHLPANHSVYQDCIDQCRTDQNNLCGYTEIHLPHTAATHIDHYLKRDLFPKDTFEWGNLIAAIHDSHFGADWKDNCSHLKKSDYQQLINPVTDELNGRFQYSTDGTIEPADPNDTKASHTIRIFNLNADQLKALRKNVMLTVRSLIEGGLSREEIINFLSAKGMPSVIDYELQYAVPKL